MIIAKTKLKKIPDKCNKCRFCFNDGVTRKACRESNWIADTYVRKRCSFTGATVPYVYIKEKETGSTLSAIAVP